MASWELTLHVWMCKACGYVLPPRPPVVTGCGQFHRWTEDELSGVNDD